MDTSVAVRMKKWAAQVPTAWCLKLCKCLLVCSLPCVTTLSRKFYPFQTGKFYHLVSILKNTWVFGDAKKEKDLVKIQGRWSSMSKASHPTEDPRCHQLDIVVRIHNVEGGRRSPPQFFCAWNWWNGGVLFGCKCGELHLEYLCICMHCIHIIYIYIIYLYLFVPTVHNLSLWCIICLHPRIEDTFLIRRILKCVNSISGWFLFWSSYTSYKFYPSNMSIDKEVICITATSQGSQGSQPQPSQICLPCPCCSWRWLTNPTQVGSQIKCQVPSLTTCTCCPSSPTKWGSHWAAWSQQNASELKKSAPTFGKWNLKIEVVE